VFRFVHLVNIVNILGRVGPSRCGAQCKT